MLLSHRRSSLISAVGTLVMSGRRLWLPRLRRGPGLGGARSPSHPSESRNGRESQPARGEREAPTDLSSAGGASLSQRAGWGARSAATEARGRAGWAPLPDNFGIDVGRPVPGGRSSPPRRLCSYPPLGRTRNARGDPAPSPYRAPPAGVRDATRATLTRSPRRISHVSNALRVSAGRAVARSVGRPVDPSCARIVPLLSLHLGGMTVSSFRRTVRER